jgi:hypothetical protein
LRVLESFSDGHMPALGDLDAANMLIGSPIGGLVRHQAR